MPMQIARDSRLAALGEILAALEKDADLHARHPELLTQQILNEFLWRHEESNSLPDWIEAALARVNNRWLLLSRESARKGHTRAIDVSDPSQSADYAYECSENGMSRIVIVSRCGSSPAQFDSTVAVWDARLGVKLFETQGSRAQVSPDDQFLVVEDWSRSIINIFEVSTWVSIASFPGKQASISPDGAFLSVLILPARRPQSAERLKGEFQAVIQALTADRTALVSVSDTKTWATLMRFKVDDGTFEAAISKQGRWLATRTPFSEQSSSNSICNVTLWDTESQTATGTINGVLGNFRMVPIGESVNVVAVQRRMRYVPSVNQFVSSYFLVLTDVFGRIQHELEIGAPDGRNLEYARGVTLDPRQELILVDTGWRELTLWTLNPLMASFILSSPSKRTLRVHGFTTSGRYIFASDDRGDVFLWDRTGLLVAELVGPDESTDSVAVSANDAQVFTVSSTGTLFVWDVVGLSAQLSPSPVQEKLIRLNRDGTVLTLGTSDGLTLWNYSAGINPVVVTRLASRPGANYGSTNDGLGFFEFVPGSPAWLTIFHHEGIEQFRIAIKGKQLQLVLCQDDYVATVTEVAWQLWDRRSGSLRRTVKRSHYASGYLTSDGSLVEAGWIVRTFRGHWGVRIFTLANRSPFTIRTAEKPTVVEVPPYGHCITIDRHSIALYESVTNRQLWNTTPGVPLSTHMQALRGSSIVVGTIGGDLLVVDLSTGDVTGSIHAHERAVTLIAVHEEASYVVSVAEDSLLRVSSLVNSQVLATFPLRLKPTTVEWIPGTNRILFGCEGKPPSMVELTDSVRPGQT